jgi:hypothetical protein
MNKILLAFTILTTALFAEEPQIDTLFTVSDLKGTYTIFAEREKVLDEPKMQQDGIRDSSIIQMHTDAKGTKKYFLIHNTGRSEIVLLPERNNWTFIESLGDTIFTHMICFDHKLADGSYLILTSGTRAGVLGVTSGRLFSGKAQPSPIFKVILNKLEEQKK